MEKNQQSFSNEAQRNSAQQQQIEQQPGQQLPAGNQLDVDHTSTDADKMEQHSEGSFPQHDNETLGTP